MLGRDHRKTRRLGIEKHHRCTSLCIPVDCCYTRVNHEMASLHLFQDNSIGLNAKKFNSIREP